MNKNKSMAAAAALAIGASSLLGTATAFADPSAPPSVSESQKDAEKPQISDNDTETQLANIESYGVGALFLNRQATDKEEVYVRDLTGARMTEKNVAIYAKALLDLVPLGERVEKANESKNVGTAEWIAEQKDAKLAVNTAVYHKLLGGFKDEDKAKFKLDDDQKKNLTAIATSSKKLKGDDYKAFRKHYGDVFELFKDQGKAWKEVQPEVEKAKLTDKALKSLDVTGQEAGSKVLVEYGENITSSQFSRVVESKADRSDAGSKDGEKEAKQAEDAKREIESQPEN